MKKIKVGHAFSDFIYSEKTSRGEVKHLYKDDFREDKTRSFILPLAILLGSLLLLGRLFYLQIIKGSEIRLLSDANRTRTTIIHAPRGIIFDRSGTPLVFNAPGYRKTVNGKTVFYDEKTALSLLAKNENLDIDSLRYYPYKDVFAHVLGYVGQITADELKLPQFEGYNINDIVGKMGIEEEYEGVLKGTDGEKLVEIDATGKPIRTLGITDPVPGQNITLTLDNKLQKAVYDATTDVAKGAVIVSRPDGEILSILSRPSFDPNLFTMGKTYEPSAQNKYLSVESIINDSQSQPFLDRAISGVYPPGSTFKLITAASALESGLIDKDYTVEDTGIITIGQFSFSNWYYSQYGGKEGQVDVVKAIKRSNDIFFYKVGALVGVDKISSEANKFGAGHTLGIDLIGEKQGLVPTKEWKQKVIGDQWYLGDDYHYAIGQGYLLTTPLQVNAWTQAIANGGILYQPHILKSQNSRVLEKNLLKQDNFDLIRQGMIEACSTGGVAWPLFNFKVKNSNLKIDGLNFLEDPTATTSGSTSDYRKVVLACKTGTAQHGNETTEPHAWITLFAPAYDPQIVVTVLVESSGEGSNVAGPIAKKILESYFASPSQN